MMIMSKASHVRKYLLKHANKLSDKDWKQCKEAELKGEIGMAELINHQ